MTVGNLFGPDERTYWSAVETLRARGWRGFRKLATDFVATPAAASLPSPIRWLWLVLNRLAYPFGRHAVPVASALAIPLVAWLLFGSWVPVALVASSPLLWMLARRSLQDATVALSTLLALLAAVGGSPIWLGVALLALLGLKEASVFALPAIAAVWLMAGHPLISGAAALCASVAAFLAVSRLLLGPQLWPLLKALRGGHDNDYAAGYQRGSWHRLAVDLAIVSPIPVLLFVGSAAVSSALAVAAVLLVAAHALAPIRNVRTVLAADLLIRGVVGIALVGSLGPCALAPLLAADIYGIRKLFGSYDPITATLTQAFRMAK